MDIYSKDFLEFLIKAKRETYANSNALKFYLVDKSQKIMSL